MKRLVWIALPTIVLATIVLAACGGGASSAVAAGVETVPAAEVAQVIDSAPEDLVVLDVRTPEEFGQGHLAQAVNLDFYDPGFGDDLANLDKDVPYVLYCRSGNRSASVAGMMEDLGFAEVYELGGGILAWVEADLPVVATS